ncbi:MAG: lysylphosphatidylglycerol synthase transmembrane domain-containing protein [Dehalococcoidales bacterium]
MDNTEKQKRQSHPLFTVFVIGLMILVGAVIIFLDRNQVKQVWGKAEWNYLGVAMGFVAVSYLLGSISMVVVLRAFGVGLNKFYLLQVAFVSDVLSTLIALPASLALRLLVLGRRGVTPGQIVGSSLLLSYFKNLVFFILIPISLVYIIFAYPLVFGGVAIMVLLIVILVIVIAVAIFILYNTRTRTFVLRVLSKIWHFVTHKDIEKRLSDFGNSLTQGILQLKDKPKLAWLLAVLIIGDVATMIAGLSFGFKALGIPVHLGVLITGFNFGITLTVISFIPGDLGVQEASIAGILAIFGVPFSLGVLGAILFRVLYYFVPFIFSLGFYWSLLREKPVKQN